MTTSSLEALRAVLAQHRHGRIPAERALKKAAVAAIVRESAGLELLFIRRAEHPRDPWSGHMAFPGGRVDKTDASPLAAALRETREEIGLDLMAHGQQIGELSHVPAVAHGKPLPMIIVPFVFQVKATPSFALDPREVQEALWVPLSFLADPKERKTMERKFAGVPLQLPCYHFEGRLIWGLTLRMADELLGLAGPERG